MVTTIVVYSIVIALFVGVFLYVQYADKKEGKSISSARAGF